MCDEDWVKVAMADDSLVVELLLRLHQAQLPPPPVKRRATPACHQLDWKVRQRRSKSASRHVDGAEKKAEPTRASPTTPLSWSGATSASAGGGVDGFEESSRLKKPSGNSRSKPCNVFDPLRKDSSVYCCTQRVVNPTGTTTKRSRRKKTLPELKEEESVLLKERRNLKNEIASLRLTVEKHRAANERLKRMKLNMEPQEISKPATASVASGKAIFEQPEDVETKHHPSNSISPASVTLTHQDSESSSSANASCTPETMNQQASVKHKDFNLISLSDASSNALQSINQVASFLLPDLNLPVDEAVLGSNAIHGIS